MIELTQRGDVAVLQIVHGKANALDIELCEAIAARFRQLETAAARAVVMTGQGRMFSAGVDLLRLTAGGADYVRQFLPALHQLYETVFHFPKPVVAAVNGHAIAGGCVLALCCDLRIMTDDTRARIGLNEVALGLEFPPKILALARRRVPRRWLERVVLEAGLHAPAAACELGLVDEVAADCLAVARARLETLAAHAPRVYAATKDTLRRGTLALSDDERRYFRDTVVPAWCAPETKARIRAVFERRG
jgi:enoyl-CoA hydratase